MINIRNLSAALVCALGLPLAAANEVYVPVGIPGIGIGYSYPLNEQFAVRADFMTLGQRNKTVEESGNTYQGHVKLERVALLADVFPFSGTFRVTAGLVASNYKLALDANGAGGSLEIGDRRYTTTAADGVNVQIKFPRTVPYLGLGWGHQKASGWRFSADLGAAIGKATVTAAARGNLALESDIQANLDKELVQLRDGVGKVKLIPQISLGFGYSF